MKNFIAIFLLLLSTHLLGQKYPRVEVDSAGQTIVIMTLEQAQALDQASDLLLLFEKMDAEFADYDYACIKVINQQGQLITSLDRENLNLRQLCEIKDNKIDTLQANIVSYIAKEETWKTEAKNNQRIQEEYKTELNRSKWKNIIGGSSSGLIIVGLITALILK